jgi:hypothetical protein
LSRSKCAVKYGENRAFFQRPSVAPI